MQFYSKSMSPYLIVLIRYVRRFIDVISGTLSFKLLEWEVCLDVAKILLRQARFQEAHPYFRRLIALKSDTNTYLLIIELLFTYEKFEDAVLYLKQLTSKQPTPENIRKLRYFLNRAGKDNPSFIDEALALPETFGKEYKEYLDLVDVEGYYTDGLFFYSIGRMSEFAILASKAMEIQDELAKIKGLDKLGVRYLESKNWTGAIGHIALLDFYAKAKILGLQCPHVLLAKADEIANIHYLSYWEKYINMIFDDYAIKNHEESAKYLINYPLILPLENQWVWMHNMTTSIQKKWESENREPLLTLSNDDYERGWQALSEIGICKHDWFVCFHVREPGFHNQWHEPNPSLRSANIDNYVLAMQLIVERGGWVIRLGDPSMKALPEMPQVVDYANSPLKSDWMDVFLCAQCRFFVGTNSGIRWVIPTFGVPCVLAGWVPLADQLWCATDIMIPKLLWVNAEKRYMTFSESVQSPASHVEFQNQLSDMGMSLIENTPEDIRDVVLEKLDELDGQLEFTQEDLVLQEKLQSIFQSSPFLWPRRVGRNFLRKYADLI